MTKRLILVCLLTLCVCRLAMAIDAIEFGSAQALDRYQQLTYELRCPKCQNQNLIDSDSQISEDLRREVARMIKEGNSDAEIKSRMVALYGDFILYKPPVQTNTIVLWLGPVVMLGLGIIIFAVILYRRSRIADSDDADTDEFLS